MSPDGRRTIAFQAVLCASLALVTYSLFTMRSLIAPLAIGLDTTVGTVQISLVLFSLVAAVTAPSFSLLSALRGERWTIRVGLVLSLASAVVTALSPTIVAVIVGFSLLGGLAAAPLLAQSWTLMQRHTQGRQRDLGLAALGVAVGIGSAVAPSVTGLLADAGSWRWALLPQALMAAVMFPSTRLLPSTPTLTGRSLNWLATMLALAGFGLVLTGVSLAGEFGWWDARKEFKLLGVWPQPFSISIAPVLALAGVGFLCLWILERTIRRRDPSERAFRPGLLRHRQFLATTVTAALHGVGLSGLFFALFVYVPWSYKLSGFTTALAIMPLNLAIPVTGVVAGLCARWIVPRIAVQAGLVAGICGTALLFQAVSVDGTLVELVPGMLLLGVGAGLVYAQAPLIAFALPEPDELLEANGMFNAFQDLGGSLGTALLGGVFMISVSLLIVDGVSRSAPVSFSPEARRELVIQLDQALQTMKPEVRAAAVARMPAEMKETLEPLSRQASVNAMRLTLAGVGGALLLALIVSTALPRRRSGSPG